MQQMEWGVFPSETEEEYLGAAYLNACLLDLLSASSASSA